MLRYCQPIRILFFRQESVAENPKLFRVHESPFVVPKYPLVVSGSHRKGAVQVGMDVQHFCNGRGEIADDKIMVIASDPRRIDEDAGATSDVGCPGIEPLIRHHKGVVEVEAPFEGCFKELAGLRFAAGVG